MKKGLIILLIALISTLLITFFIIKPQITGYSINPLEYSYTKAMCNESNYCQDYEIHCYNEKLVRITPISGASVQHSIGWKDPREKTDIENLCNYTKNS